MPKVKTDMGRLRSLVAEVNEGAKVPRWWGIRCPVGFDYWINTLNDATIASQIEKRYSAPNLDFGPVVSIDSFSTVNQAISRSNNSTYGLGAVVFGQQNAAYVAEQLEAGMVGINKGPGSGYGPWVGAKQSGFGYHGTASGHRQFTQTKVIN